MNGLGQNPLNYHLLNALKVLLDEQSVTRAANRLQMSQPAASLILRQLREIFGDPLLVRAGGGMVRTERGEQLRGAARQLLAEMDSLLVSPDDFTPAESRATFTIAMPDHILPQMFNGVMREFRRQAPLARLSIRALGPDNDFEGALASGATDLVISNWPTPPDYLRIAPLFEDEFVCVVDKDHPFAKSPPTLQDYFAASHVAPGDYAIAHRGVVETFLTENKLARERRVVVGYFSMAPYLVPGTDLVFTVTRRFAEHFAGFLPLAIVPSPVVYPPVAFYQLWHERMQHSPMHRWFRHLVGSMKRLSADQPYRN
ncbi:LysR family transcriptional regulator [Paracoccus aestuariivivens]|uniref:LysR family transcriptional regulator n=1 Tax=Paracoccus aestuariivivens TaxID=1820333 RepID=A0A6L6JCN2_9RHOB|nr:LysR family transcriptional regulator [Paracoccus aestuariivivens]MTH78489.1 LysR family transcriptional regulator [Paracoccus aestuariivivens]